MQIMEIKEQTVYIEVFNKHFVTDGEFSKGVFRSIGHDLSGKYKGFWVEQQSKYVFSKEQLIELIKFAQGATLAENLNQAEYLKSLFCDKK
jgi:hypothetical protein